MSLQRDPSAERSKPSKTPIGQQLSDINIFYVNDWAANQFSCPSLHHHGLLEVVTTIARDKSFSYLLTVPLDALFPCAVAIPEPFPHAKM